jgi:hypothetical protein
MGGALGLAILASLAAARTDNLLESGADTLVALNGGYQAAFLVGANEAIPHRFFSAPGMNVIPFTNEFELRRHIRNERCLFCVSCCEKHRLCEGTRPRAATTGAPVSARTTASADNSTYGSGNAAAGAEDRQRKSQEEPIRMSKIVS